MGCHHCHHPCWHRALILFGTLGYWYGVGSLGMWLWQPTTKPEVYFWGIVVWLVSTWLFQHLLQWRCQGQEPSDGRWAQTALWFMASAALLTHDDND